MKRKLLLKKEVIVLPSSSRGMKMGAIWLASQTLERYVGKYCTIKIFYAVDVIKYKNQKTGKISKSLMRAPARLYLLDERYE